MTVSLELKWDLEGMKYSPAAFQDGCLYHCSDIREKTIFLLFKHHKALLSPSSVEKVLAFLIKGQRRKARISELVKLKRERTSSGLPGQPGFLLGLYLNSRAHIKYVSAQFLIFFSIYIVRGPL